MPSPTPGWRDQFKIRQGSAHHLDIMRVLLLAFIRLCIPRTEARANAMCAIACGRQVPLITNGDPQAGQRIGCRYMGRFAREY
jgi:hypothetical protein